MTQSTHPLEPQEPFNYNDPSHPYYFDGTLVALSYLVASFFSFIGAVIIYLWKRDSASPWTHQALKDVLNFSISYFIYIFIAGLSLLILIGIILLPVVILLYFIFAIIAIVKTAKGDYYKPPFIIDFF